MAQQKVNRQLANLGAGTNMNEWYAMGNTSKSNSPLFEAGKNNLLPLQTIHNDENEEASADATTMVSLFSPPNNNSTSTNLSQNSARMKCYFHGEQNCFLNYFDDPILDDAGIYMSEIPFQSNKREVRYTEFMGNPTGTIL